MSFQYNESNNIHLADVLKSVSDVQSLSIFELIADANFNGEIILKKFGLSCKQDYPRISGMMAAGLIKRKGGR
jgi:hypothetical protein